MWKIEYVFLDMSSLSDDAYTDMIHLRVIANFEKEILEYGETCYWKSDLCFKIITRQIGLKM